MSIKKLNGKSNFVKIFTLILIALSALSLAVGCGGGSGSSSSSTAEDIGPIVSIIEGYVYAPSSGATAPQNQAPEVSIQPSTAENILLPQVKAPAASSSEISAAAKASGASPAVSRATIIPTSGYVPLVGATVQLGGTNKATVTNPIGYYRFEIGQKEITAFGSKKLMINKSEANVSIEFDVEIVSGDSRYILTEINTKTGEKTVKETLTNRVQSPFIFVSGKATGATGVALANALVTAVKVSNTAFIKTAYTDAYGRYSFSEINDGLYTLTVEKANYKTTSKNVEVSSDYTLSNIDFLIPGTFSLTPRIVNPELSAVKIVYATSVPTAYTIEYGLSTTYLYSSTSNLYNLTNEITLTNLSPKTVYHYKIKAIDQYGNAINTDDATFETLDPNTNSKEAPLVNSNYTIRKTHNSITLTFNTNMSSYAQIEYAVSSAAVYTRYPVDGSEIGPQTNFEITLPNLVNSTTYKLFIITKNIANRSVFRREPQQLPIQVTTDNSPDLTPPVVSGVTVTELKAKEATINFSAIDIHESIRNNTDAKIYYGLASYPTLQYDYSVIPPKVRLDYYQKISETLTFNFDSDKVIRLTGLEPSKKYYFRPSSNDPSGNIGTVTDEISFTTAAPGTALTFALSESPATGQISVGEHAKIFRIIAKGSTEENLIIKKMVFKQTGTIPYNAIDKLTVTDGVNTWTVTTPVSSNIEVKFDSPTLSIPKNNSMYLTMNMTLNTSALNPGGAPRDVKLKLDANSATETNVEVTGDIYDAYVKDKVSGLVLESNAQAVNIGQLVLSPPVETQDSTSTSLVNRGQKDIILFKFKLESLYEDINITKIQLSQIGTAIAETDYSNIRLYDGISSLAVGASSGSDILFQSATGLVKVAKGTTTTKTLSIVADIQQGATDARYLRMQIDKINISGSGSYSAQNVDVLGVGTPVTGAKFTIGDSELLAARTTDSPTKQTFKIGDTNKTFTILQLTAGSAEDVRIDTMELMFQGTASFTSSAFSIVDENNTVIYSKSVGGGGITAETGYNAATKKFAVVPQSSLIVPKGSSKKIYIKGNISSTAFEVGKTIQINIANDGDILGTGVQTNSSKAAVGTAIGSEHSIIGGIVMTAVLPQPSNVLLPGSKYNDTPNNNTFLKFKITPSGESVDVQSFNFSFSGSYSVLDNLRVIEYIDAATTVEVAINPVISGSTITLAPQSTVNITTAGKTFYLVGDILTTAVSSDSIKFSILQDGNVVSGVNSKQIYKTQEIINGNALSVSTEAFYIIQSSRITPETMLIGSSSTQEVYSFKLEAKPRSGYYLQKLTLRQLGTATFGLGQDFSADDFEFLKSGDGVTFTKASATITVSGTNLSIEFPGSSDVRIDATAQTVSSQFLTCAVVCKTLKTAINNKTLKFYLDDSLTVAKSVTSDNQITGGSSTSITGTAVTLKEGALTANIRGDNPAVANITDSLEMAYLSFDLAAEAEALDVQSILVTLDVKNGLITDFDPTSMKISVGGVAFPNSTVSSSGNKFTVIPLDNAATPKYMQVPANSSVKVTISGKANYTAAQNGSQIALRIADNSDIMSVGATSTHKIYSTGIINGNYMTVSKSASSLTVTLDASNPAGAVLTDTTAANMFIIKLTAGTSEDIKLTKLNLTYDGLANNFDASSISIIFGAPVSKTYTSANIVFSNNIFTLDIPVSDTITIPNAGVLVTVNGKRSSAATSGQQFFFRISGDGDLVGTGANSGLAVLSTGTASGNKFTIDAANTNIKAYLNAAFSSDNPGAATVAAGQRLLVGKIDLQTKKDAATNFVDSARIKSIELTKGGTTANTDVTKWELTDGTSTFTVSDPATGAIKFDNMNYIVPLASTSTVTTMKTLSIYATVKDSVRNLTLLFTITSGKVLADGALYGNAATVEPWNTTPATVLTSGTQTLDAGKMVLADDAGINATPGSGSAGDVNVSVLGMNVSNDDGAGGAVDSPEDVYITVLKLTNSGTGVLGTDVDSLKFYEKVGAVETFIANASLMTDTATSQKYFQFSDSQLYKIAKNGGVKNLILKANVPATATNGKTIKLSLLAADITGKGYNSNISIAATGVASITGKNIIIGTNSLTVALDSTSPAETNIPVDETEREAAVFQVKTGTGEGITLDLSTKSFEYSGTIPQTDIATVKLKYNNTEYPLTAVGVIYTTATPIALSNNTTALFSILVKLKPAATPLTLTAGQYFEFKIAGAGNSMLTGTSSITTATINSTNGTPAPTSNKFIAVGKLALASDDSGNAPSGNILIGDTNSGNGVDIFRFKLTPTSENAKVDSIKFYLDKGSFTTDIDTAVANLKLKYNNTGAVFAGGDVINTAAATKTISGNYLTFSGLSTIAPFSGLVKDTVYYIGFAGNIKSTSAAGTAISMKIESVSDISAIGVLSSKSITPSGTSVSGNTLTTVSGGLSIADAKTFDTKEIIINDGSSKLAAVVKLTASNTEKLGITEIKINIDGDVDFTSDFDSGTPYGFKIVEMNADNVTASNEVQMTSVTKSGNQITFALDSSAAQSLFVNSNSTKNIIIEATPKSTATAGHKAKIIVESGWIKAAGVTSAKSITSTGNVNYSSGTMQEFINGILNAAVSSSSPSAKTILKGQTGVELAKFELKSANSANNNQIEDIKISRIEIYTSSDTTNFTNTRIQVLANDASTYTMLRDGSLSSSSNHVFIPLSTANSNTVTLGKDNTVKTVTLISDAASVATGKIYSKLIASGTRGTGVVSGKAITCTSSDQTAAEHTVGSAQMVLSSNSSISPQTAYLDVTSSSSSDKLVMGANLNIDDKEAVAFNAGSRNIQVKLEGTVNKAAITALKIKTGSSFASVWLNALNPFNNASVAYNGDFADGGVAIADFQLSKSTLTQFKVFVTLDQTLVADGDTMKITIINAGMVGAGAVSAQSAASQNELSNTLTLQKTSVAISANIYTAATYKRNDTAKTIIDFKVSAGRYQSLSVNKIYMTNDASGTKTSFDITNTTTTTPELSNFKLYVDGVLYSGTVTASNSTDTSRIALALSSPVTIAASGSRSFKVAADFTSKAQNGSNIKAKTDYSYYLTTDFTPALAATVNITGNASGNEHAVQVIETVDFTVDAASPSSSNITITPVSHREDGTNNFAHIATYKLKCSEAATLTSVKFKYAGSSISDVSSFEGYVGTSSSTYAEGTKFTSAVIDSANNKVVFSHAGITLASGTSYYFKIGTRVPNSASLPVIGHAVRLQTDSSNSSDPDYPPVVLSSPAKGSLAANVADIVYNATTIGNSIYIDSPEVVVKAECETLSDVSTQFPTTGVIADHKIMEISIANSSVSDYTINRFVIDIRQEGSQAPFDTLTSSMALGVYEGSTKIADASVAYDSSKLSGTFTINNFSSSYNTILKGQSKKYSVKFSSGTFTGVSSAKVVFGIKYILGTHATGGSSLKGTQYSRLPLSALKYFAWSSSGVSTVSTRSDNEANALADFKTYIALPGPTIINLRRSITFTEALTVSNGAKLINLNGYTINTGAWGFNITTNTTMKNGSFVVFTGGALNIAANVLYTTESDCNSLWSAAPTINLAAGGTLVNNGTIISDADINGAGFAGTFINNGTFTNNSVDSISGTVKAGGGAVTFNGSSAVAVPTLTVDTPATSLTIGVPVASLEINQPVNTLTITKTITNMNVKANTTLSNSSTLTVGTSCNIFAGVTLINNGQITNSGTISNSGTLTHNNNSAIGGTVKSVTGDVVFNGTSSGGISLLQAGGNANSLKIDLPVTAFDDDLSARVITTFTMGTNGSITTTNAIGANLTLTNIDQSSVAADKTINLNDISTTVSSVKGHASNKTTITGSALTALTVTQGVVDLSGCAGTLNIAATAPVKVTATTKTLAAVSGATTIEIDGATAATVSGNVTALTVSSGSTVGTLTVSGLVTVTTLSVNGTITTLGAGGGAVVTTMTVGSAGAITTYNASNNLTVTNIDQSAVAADKTINLNNMNAVTVSSVKGHATNKLTLSSVNPLTSCTITSGNVDISGLLSTTINVTATDVTKVTAAGKTLASVSGATTIEIAGATAATVTGDVTALTVTAATTVTTLTIGAAKTVGTLSINGAVTTLAAGGAGAAITTLTLGSAGSITNVLATAGNLTIAGIDQSAVAANRTIALGNMTTAISSVKGHSTNTLELTSTAALASCTITAGSVDVDTLLATALNVSAVSSTKVVATGKALNSVSGATTIDIAGATAVTVSGIVTTLNLSGNITTSLTINSTVNTLSSSAGVTLTSLTIGSGGSITNALATGGNLTITGIDQSAVASDAAVSLGSLSTAIATVKGHAANKLTLSSTGALTMTVVSGIVDISGCAGTLNIAATAAAKVTASTKTLAAVSGATTIDIAGASAATISGAVTTLNISDDVTTLTIGAAVTTLNLSAAKTITTLSINNTVTTLAAAGAGAVITTMTLNAAGVITNALATGANLTITNIDQNAVAAIKTIALGTMTTAISSVKGNAANKLTLTSTGYLSSCTITGGDVDITGMAETTFNVIATEAAKVTATGKTLASVSGAVTIDIAGATSATVSGAVTTLTVSAAVTTLTIGAPVTNSSIVTGTNVNVTASGSLSKGAGTGIVLGDTNTITMSSGGIISTTITGRTATATGVAVAGVTPTTSGADCTVGGTATGNGAKIAKAAAAATVTVTAL